MAKPNQIRPRPKDHPGAPDTDIPPSRSLGELASFVLTGLRAIVEFWLPTRRPEPEVAEPDPEDAPPEERPAKVLDRIAPYPVQEG